MMMFWRQKPCPGALVWQATSLLMLLSLAACGTDPADMGNLAFYNLSGRVTEAATGVAVVGATVSGGGKVAQTDGNGRYALENTDAGPNRVRITHPDYQPAEGWVDIKGMFTVQDFQLDRK
jgi:hypothetical protein